MKDPKENLFNVIKPKTPRSKTTKPKKKIGRRFHNPRESGIIFKPMEIYIGEREKNIW